MDVTKLLKYTNSLTLYSVFGSSNVDLWNQVVLDIGFNKDPHDLFDGMSLGHARNMKKHTEISVTIPLIILKSFVSLFQVVSE